MSHEYREGDLYRVESHNNRYPGGPEAYFSEGDIVAVTYDQDPDGDNEVFVRSTLDDKRGYVLVKALTPLDAAPKVDVVVPSESAVNAAIVALRLNVTGEQINAVLDLAKKIEEAL